MAEAAETGLIHHPDQHPRCWWPGSDLLYLKYHDTEWGRPTDDEVRLFEKICLEGFQAGLSWLTILRKRENFREAFDGFSVERIARYTPRTVTKLLGNAGIVRHRGKIESTINNGKRAIELRKEFGSLAAYIWSFEPAAAERPKTFDLATLKSMATTPASVALSKDLRKRGWSFVGPTTMYAFMQSTGIVNDHLEGCAFRSQCEAARKRFRRPVRKS